VCARSLWRPDRLRAWRSLDNETDRRVQRVIRTQLANCLVLTIAHRLETVIDCDRVVLLAKGEIAENGSPAELLARPESAFRRLCERSGAYEALLAAAKARR
jgi:ABC-type multidrug transport system fused ATPase/permease subunit